MPANNQYSLTNHLNTSQPTPNTSPESLNRTFGVPETDSDSGEDCSREGSLERTDAHERAVSVGSSNVDSESSMDEPQILSFSQRVDVTEGHPKPSVFASMPQESHEAPIYPPHARPLSVSSVAEVFDLTEDEVNDIDTESTKKANLGASQANPINLEDTTKVSSYDVVSDSDDEGPEVLPIKAMPSTFHPASSPGGLSQPVVPLGVTVVEGQNAAVQDVAGPTIADSDLDDTESEINFSSDDDMEAVKELEGQDKNRKHDEWAPGTSSWAPEYSEDDDGGDDLGSTALAKGERKVDVVPQIGSGPDKTTRPRVHFAMTHQPVIHHPRVLVEDSQVHDTILSRPSFGDPLDVSHENLHPWVRPLPRAPSPSDAALAKMPTECVSRSSTGDMLNETNLKISKLPVVPNYGSVYSSSKWFDFGAASNPTGFTNYAPPQDSYFDSADRSYPRYDDGPFSGWPKYETLSGAPQQHYNYPSRQSHRYEPANAFGHVNHHELPYWKCGTGLAEDALLIQPQHPTLSGQEGKAQEQHTAAGVSEHKSSKLPISDIVNSSSSKNSTSTRSLKRKADELVTSDATELTVPEASPVLPTVDECQEAALPDAQPREQQMISESFSQETLVQSIPKAVRVEASNDPEGPVRKKVKTTPGRPGRVGAFVSGMVVGGLSLAGAFAAFIATIPDSVKDEVRREFENRI